MFTTFSNKYFIFTGISFLNFKFKCKDIQSIEEGKQPNLAQVKYMNDIANNPEFLKIKDNIILIE